MVTISYIKKYEIAGNLKDFIRFDFAFVKRFLFVTVPVIFNEIVWGLGITTQNIIFARTGTDAIAAFNITSTVSQLTWVLFIGMGNGVAVLIGKKIGEGMEDTARDYARRIAIFGPLLAAGAACILYPMSFLLPFVLNVSTTVLNYTSLMFIIICCTYPFRAFNRMLVVGICRAGGDTVYCVLLETISMWVYALPLAIIMAFYIGAPVWVIYLCICSEDVVKMLCGVWRLKNGRWLNNVIM